MQNTNFDLTFESFTIWEPAFSEAVLNFSKKFFLA